MADPGFPRGGASTYYLATCLRKLHENQRIWTKRWARVPSAPLPQKNPPLHIRVCSVCTKSPSVQIVARQNNRSALFCLFSLADRFYLVFLLGGRVSEEVADRGVQDVRYGHSSHQPRESNLFHHLSSQRWTWIEESNLVLFRI